jgi:hypothetical protein
MTIMNVPVNRTAMPPIKFVAALSFIFGASLFDWP